MGNENLNWDVYWSDFLQRQKLSKKVDEMNQIDQIRGNQSNIKDICFQISNDYDDVWYDYLCNIRRAFLEEIEKIQGVHLQSSRIKTKESLLEKVITKRYSNYKNKYSGYSKINGDNYKEIITDLIGMRMIINYRGNWNDIHKALLDLFPMQNRELYSTAHIPHSEKGDNILAEIPTAYHAHGDSVEQFESYGLIPKVHAKGYRSIHYVVSYKQVYIEIQIRTIYDEAWSDCDHNYVYKQENNKSHAALEALSKILCDLTNISSDLGENMRDIFVNESIVEKEGKYWQVPDEYLDEFDKSLVRIEEVCSQLKRFKERMIPENDAVVKEMGYDAGKK